MTSVVFSFLGTLLGSEQDHRLARLVGAALRRVRSSLNKSAVCKRRRWSIGICELASLQGLSPDIAPSIPVLGPDDISGIATDLVADPFMVRRDDVWYMFFEVLNKRAAKGEIGLATSRDMDVWVYEGIVLEEDFHLSYPYVFEWGGEFYMVPEAYQSDSVRLYRAEDFPSRWVFMDTLLTGREFVDPSVFRFSDMWWMFVGDGSLPFRADVLRLYYSENLSGPWTEHPMSPVIDGDARNARPAGRVVTDDGKIIRFAQDCATEYGTLVRAFEITELTTTGYEESPVKGNPVLKGSGSGWNAGGMHHIDIQRDETGRWIGCVDGWTVEDSIAGPTREGWRR